MLLFLSNDNIENSQKIFQNIYDWNVYQRSMFILLFWGIQYEPKTYSLIKNSLMLKRVFLPFSKKLSIGEIKNLPPEQSKIYEEFSAIPKSLLKKIDLVLVPGMAFTENGDRLGRGSGWYDKFLPLLNKNVPKVGLAFENQIITKIPNNSLDHRLDYIITENTIYKTSIAS